MLLHNRIVLCFLFYFIVAVCSSQPSAHIDSLNNALKKHPSDSLAVFLNNQVAIYYLHKNDDSVKKYILIARKVALQKKISTELSRNYTITGNLNYSNGITDTAFNYYTKALIIDIRLKAANNMIDDYMHLGRVYASNGNIDKALEYLFKAEELAKKVGSKEQEADCLFRIAVIYDRQDQPQKAITFCENAITIQKEIKDSAGIAYSYHRMGLCYEGIKKYDEALKYLELSYDIRKKIRAEAQYGASLNGIGLVYMDKGDYQKALLKFYDAYKYWLGANDKEGIVIATGNLGELSIKMNDDDNALKYFLQSYKVANEIHALSFQKGTLRALAEIYYRKGDYKIAYDYFNKFSELKDKLYNDENSKRMAQMQSQYGSEQKEQQIKLLTKEKELRDSELGQKRIFMNALMLAGLLVLLLAFMFYNRYRLKQKANESLQGAFEEIEEKNEKLIQVYNVLEQNRDEIITKNKEITDSIKYAKRLQEAILPSDEFIKSVLPESFVYYKPKDIVSGDFYWFELIENKIFIAAVDCTGHGVPGAFMSIVGYNLLNQTVNEKGLLKPNLILDALNKGITKTLKQSIEDSSVKDGMDIALVAINAERTKLEFSGAYNSLWLFRKETFIEIRADKQPVGVFMDVELKPFRNNEMDIQRGDTFYIFTDGYADQFGGPKGKKFKYAKLKELLLSIQHLSMNEQQIIMNQKMEEWKGNLEQVDDILIIGIRL
jgi:serine phosphatase RsbU (regulator of sigma subunit)